MSEVEVFGIDLGTTNSAIAVWDSDEERVRIIPNGEGRPLTPSVVAFDPDTGKIAVGEAARQRMVEHPNEVAYSVKRFIGRTFRDEWVSYDQGQVTYDIEEAPQRKVLIRLGNRLWTPSQIQAEVLRKLKQDAELGPPPRKIERAVITVPAYFDESQRQATKEAGDLAGLKVPRIINEPTAAALAFGLGTGSHLVAVYDLGGGTFDISILWIDRGYFKVRATYGDTHLGGDDFDKKIVDWLQEKFEAQHDGTVLPVDEDDELRSLLRQEAEQAKIALSDEEQYVFDLDNVLEVDGQWLGLKATLTRAELEDRVQELIDRALAACDIALERANVKPDEIEKVLMVGGQTRMPAVRESLENKYRWKLNTDVKPEEAVALGAAMLGARLCGYLRDQIKLRDVVPLSLGIELRDGRMDPIIRANENIPRTVWREGPDAFTTHEPGQMRIRLRVYQGERPVAAHNRLLKEVILNLAAPRPAGEPQINVMFKVDQDGILHVRAEDADTDAEPVEVTIDYAYSLSQEEMEFMQQEAETHREEDALASRLFHLGEELAHLQRTVGADRAPEDPFLATLEDLEAAIRIKDADRAERLLEEIGGMM
jgi:molecular chaperone DnaK